MSPKKIVDKTPVVGKNAQGKTAKRPRVTKEKPKLKTPTVFKFKLPAKSSTKKGNKDLPTAEDQPAEIAAVKPAKVSRKRVENLKIELSSEDKKKVAVAPPMAKHAKLTKSQFAKMKTELANEVSHLQLMKTPAQKTSIETNEAKPVKRKGRKKNPPKEIQTDGTAVTTDSEDAFEKPPPKKKSVRKAPSKLVKNNEVIETDVEVKLEDDVTPSKKLKQTKITDMKKSVTRNSKTTNSRVRCVKICNKPKRILRPRGKKTCIGNTTEPDKSPSILNQELENEVKEEITETSPCSVINSRKTSTSMSESPSWTKDISDSSTTTCITVGTSDFVRIDKKMPTVKLTNIDHKLKLLPQPKRPADSESSTNWETTDSSTNHSSSVAESSLPEIDASSLHLSTSSISFKSSEKPELEVPHTDTINDSVNKIGKALDKLSTNLKKIDLEIINWIGYQNEDTELDINENKLQEKMFQILDEESNVIVQCQNIKKVLSDTVTLDEVVNSQEVQCTTEDKDDALFVKPTNVIINRNVSNNKDYFTSELNKQKSVEPTSNHNISSEKSINDKPGNSNYPASGHASYDDDDDDTLSLYAESITGMDSSRRNSTTGSPPPANDTEFEEYIPKPILPNVDLSAQRFAYNPTKINKDANKPARNIITTTVCEKQNADSTSIYKDPVESVQNVPEGNAIGKFNSHVSQVPVNNATCSNSLQPPIYREHTLFSVLYKPPPAVKSIVFKGMCFFNLISSCKNASRCNFPHVVPKTEEIMNKISKLSEDMFIHEYMLMKSWPILRRKYGVHFVNECQRRELPRLLVEMAIDFVMRANPSSREDSELKVYVVELALLQLNTVGLEPCKDLLKFNIDQNTVLCDVFMRAIANTQNFSRFKVVFVSMAEFVIENGRSFAFDVASQILERIAILPYEEPLARTLIKIIEHTSPSIFENSMIGHFEKQLYSKNQELYQAFLMLKDNVGQFGPSDSQRECLNVRGSCTPSPCPIPEMEQITVNSLVYPDREQRYTSPDTTHLDNLNKVHEEPIITRTINFDMNKSYNTPSYSGSNSSESADEYRPTNNHNSRFNWRDKSFNYRPFTPPARGQMNRRNGQRQVMYGGSPAKMPRRSGPDFN